jgi:palmitoyltransferase ZDHHC9/14/18
MEMSTPSQRLLRWLVALPTEPSEKTAPGRNYAAWNSHRTVFLLGGHLRTMYSKLPVVLLTGTLVVLHMVLFAIFEASWAWHNVSAALVIFYVLSWLVGMSSFVKAASYDPGALPNNIHLTSAKDCYSIPTEYRNSITLPGLTGDAVVKYCVSCRDWRPPRSFHCSKCDHCITLHDHHCVWLGNCIGERNYRYFFTFLLFGTISSAYLAAVCYYRLFHNSDPFRETIRHSPMTLFNAVYGSLTLLYPMLLLGYNFYLTSTQQTTREFLRTLHASERNLNPYRQDVNVVFAFIQNLTHVRGYSFVRPRERYQEGDQRFVRF